MVLIRRVMVFIVIFIFYIGLNTYQIPTDGVQMLQVETKVNAFYFQSTGSVFSYDNDVISELQGVPYSRFSFKITDGESVLNDLFVTFRYSEKINGDIVEYYYSPILESYIELNGEKVNLQVCWCGEIATIGYPLIDIGF